MLFINLEVRRGILFIRLNGVLNKETSSLLKDKVRSLSLQGFKYFVFNLDGITMMDQDGLTSLQENYQQIRKIEGKLILCGLKKKVENSLFHELGLSNVIKTQNELRAFQIFKL